MMENEKNILFAVFTAVLRAEEAAFNGAPDIFGTI
jgi:hypothetical protein